MYHGIKFSDLKDIVAFIVNNYDKSVDYINNFIKTRLDLSMEEEDEIPPPLDYKKFTYQIGDHTETIDIENEGVDSIKDAFDDILTGLEAQQQRNTGSPLIVQRRMLVSRLSNKINLPKNTVWGYIKEYCGWTNSRQELDPPGSGSFKFKILY
jgi:hypothetical protein